MNEIKEYTKKVFEDIKHVDESGNEYWLARELQKVLEYKDWRNFNKVIDKAIISANNSYPNQNFWGVEVNTPINSGRGKIEMSKDYIFNHEENKYTQGISDSILIKDLTTNDNWVFKMNYNTPKVQLFIINYSYTISETVTEGNLSYTKIHTINRYFTFYIIQQTTNFTKSNPVSYNYTDTSGITHNVSAMRTNSKINANNVKIRIPHGTVLNPIYIDFTINGENYIIYNINGVFYNNLNNKELTELNELNLNKAFNDTYFSQKDNESILALDKSGYYKIEIYDRAYLYTKSNLENMNNPNANLITDSFNLSTQAQEVYLVVETADGTQVANGQTTNNDIIAKLYNAGTVSVNKITITHENANEKSTTYTIKNWLSQSTLKKEGPITWGLVQTDESGNNTNSYVQFQLSEDGIYQFTIEYKDATIENFQYIVQIVRGLRKSYTFTDDNNKITTYTPSGDNKIETKTLSKTFNLNYSYGITNIYTNTYTVRIANSNPSITGINNNGSRNGDVTLTIRGVGDITVVVNGVKQPGTIQNGGKITLTDSGNYNVKITDALGVSKDINFTIGIKMNTASVALIVVGALLVAGVIFFIMKNRGRAKVK